MDHQQGQEGREHDGTAERREFASLARHCASSQAKHYYRTAQPPAAGSSGHCNGEHG